MEHIKDPSVNAQWLRRKLCYTFNNALPDNIGAALLSAIAPMRDCGKLGPQNTSALLSAAQQGCAKEIVLRC